MGTFHHHSRGGKRLQRKSKSEHHLGVRLAALLLCLSMLTGVLPALAQAADGGLLLSSIVTFDRITLHNYEDTAPNKLGAEIENNTLIGKNDQLVLYYEYSIFDETKLNSIKADTPYYLDVSPHLVLFSFAAQTLMMEVEDTDEKVPFGKIESDGSRAWVTFDGNEETRKTILEEQGGIGGANLYLNCKRAVDVPAGEIPIEIGRAHV